MRFRFLACVLPALLSCDAPTVAPAPEVEPPVILEVRAPSPALEGSLLEVRALGLEVYGDAPRLELLRGDATIDALDVHPDDDGDDGVIHFALSARALGALGGGIHPLDVRLLGDGPPSAAFPLRLRLVTTLPVDLFEPPSGEVFRNEVGVVNGAGIVGPTEGEITARFVGTFTADAGGATPIEVSLPVAPLERGDRERGVVTLTTDLGGLMPGTFEGTVQLSSRLRSGETSESLALETSLHFNPPTLFGLEPVEASLGQILHVRGGGFLGGAERPTETTLLRIEGMFTPEAGATPEPFGPMELVPRFVSGSEVQLVIEAQVRDVDGQDALVSALFGHAHGRFEGRATPITIAGTEELEGVSVPVLFRLGPIRQVVYVRFLPGFYDSLRRFGLASAAPEVAARVRERMEGIYAEWNVDVRLEEPDDFADTAYAVIEIGGPDPNGIGLFGYDNTPGKDIGNLRLFDQIGGTNAATQSDGYPGYGGVFVDSFLYWSSHPELSGERPAGAPEADALFDEVFDPVRTQPATRAEVAGEGASERVQAVARAVRALGSMIGETAAHEVGHSLGMAQPYGAPTAYHNEFESEGCLMDRGGGRPLGERMAEPGFAPSKLCHDQPAYLFEILGG